MADLEPLLQAAQAGDLDACRHLVEATQAMVWGVIRRIVGNCHEAEDALQETYLRAFHRLGTLREPAAVPGWLRRIAIRAAHDMIRARRRFMVEDVELDDMPAVDDYAAPWADERPQFLAEAIVALEPADRLLCERFYHGRWPVTRLAAEAGVSEATLRKRLQRLRDKLKEEIEMSDTTCEGVPGNLSAKIVELLAKPRLTTIPENPVGRMWEIVKSHWPEFQSVELLEVMEDVELETIFGREVQTQLLGDGSGIHRIDAGHYLRTSLTEPMLVAARQKSGDTLRLTAAGKVYRAGRGDKPSRTRLEAFHQAEILLLAPDAGEWTLMPQIEQLIEGLFPGKTYRMERWHYPLCERMWEVEIQWEGEWSSILAWGQYTPQAVRALGRDPQKCQAVGAGLGLERMACLYFGIDDIRKVEAARV